MIMPFTRLYSFLLMRGTLCLSAILYRSEVWANGPKKIFHKCLVQIQRKMTNHLWVISYLTAVISFGWTPLLTTGGPLAWRHDGGDVAGSVQTLQILLAVSSGTPRTTWSLTQLSVRIRIKTYMYRCRCSWE